MNPETMTDSEIVANILMLSEPAYANLSKFHRRCLEDLRDEARERKIKL